ncbi:MAG: DUF1573 domain-containing protein [Opitutus sp.]|nr:DUF1573 domain-containing protein [Opitutus sp.]
MKKSAPSLLATGFAALTALVGVVCEAAVSWSGTAAELRVAPGQDKTVAEFAFRNSGTQPMRFTSLHPSCDCLSATTSKESFAAGEAGVVRVEFTVGGRQGRQEKFVTVTTPPRNP